MENKNSLQSLESFKVFMVLKFTCKIAEKIYRKSKSFNQNSVNKRKFNLKQFTHLFDKLGNYKQETERNFPFQLWKTFHLNIVIKIGLTEFLILVFEKENLIIFFVLKTFIHFVLQS